MPPPYNLNLPSLYLPSLVAADDIKHFPKTPQPFGIFAHKSPINGLNSVAIALEKYPVIPFLGKWDSVIISRTKILPHFLGF
jgi:hypothetical protein